MNDTNTAQVYTTFIQASAQKIWKAITDGGQTEQYFYGCRVQSDFQPGSKVFYGDEDKPAASGTVESCEPPHKLMMSWHSHWCGDFDAEPASRVTWEIIPMGEVCKVTLVHDRLEHSPQTAEAVAGGWGMIIAGMKTLLETGHPMPSPQMDEAAA